MSPRAQLPAGPPDLRAKAACRGPATGAARRVSTGWRQRIPTDLLADPSVLLTFALIGFAAQLVDGALGMAFGQISSTLLIAKGVPPALASAGVHTAETFTTAVSAISHV